MKRRQTKTGTRSSKPAADEDFSAIIHHLIVYGFPHHEVYESEPRSSKRFPRTQGQRLRGHEYEVKAI